MNATHSNERWVSIVGHPGYEVSNHGEVRSLDRIIDYKDGRQGAYPGRLLKPWVSNGVGHLRVSLGGQREYVHRLVAQAFIGPQIDGYYVCHNDGNAANNHVDNLRYDSPSENIRDTRRHGTNWAANKTRCPQGHELTEPNIVPSWAKRGMRKCRACARARSNRSHNPSLDMQAESDYQYRRLMGASTNEIRE
jgi:hypothetical protein